MSSEKKAELLTRLQAIEAERRRLDLLEARAVLALRGKATNAEIGAAFGIGEEGGRQRVIGARKALERVDAEAVRSADLRASRRVRRAHKRNGERLSAEQTGVSRDERAQFERLRRVEGVRSAAERDEDAPREERTTHVEGRRLPLPAAE